MVKRAPLAAIVLAVLAASAWLLIRDSAPGVGPRAAGPIVFISIDTLRADRLPVYGSSRARTPNIDRLAADGVVFENAYAHSPQTLPSHTSMLSGQLPFEHGVRDNIGFAVRDDQRFLQHALKGSGYATAGFVSSYVLRRQTGFNHGFDAYDDELPRVSALTPLGSVQRDGPATIGRAVQWIDAQGPRFFLFAHIYEPHTPYSPPSRFTNPDPYDGEVEFSDEIVGGLLDHLRARDLYDQATIVLLSDHGEGLGDHGEEEHGVFLYRETIRVPLIIKLPASVGAGRRVSEPVQHIDLVPTMLALTGAEGSIAGLQGRSLLPVLTGSGQLPPAGIYAESLSPRYHFGWSELYALTDDRYRFIRAPSDELYDLASDPGERRSVGAERPQVRSAMRSALDSFISGKAISAPSAISASDQQKLAALGYVGTGAAASLELAGDRLADPKDRIHVLQAYRRASRLVSEGSLADAAQLYRAILRDDPAMVDAWLQLAQVSERQGNIPDALASYRQAISRDPANAAALTGAAAALLRTGRIDEARAHAELATSRSPAIAHEILARIAASQGDASDARRHAALAEQADPTLPMRMIVEGMLLHVQGQFAAAADQLLAARAAMGSRTEQLPDVNFLAGDALARLERYAEAEPLFRAELALVPTHVRARAGLAILYKTTGRDADAERAIDELVRIVPTREGFETAAQLWTMFGEPQRAAALKNSLRR